MTDDNTIRALPRLVYVLRNNNHYITHRALHTCTVNVVLCFCLCTTCVANYPRERCTPYRGTIRTITLRVHYNTQVIFVSLVNVRVSSVCVTTRIWLTHKNQFLGTLFTGVMPGTPFLCK